MIFDVCAENNPKLDKTPIIGEIKMATIIYC
jgi:hypothetical protein